MSTTYAVRSLDVSPVDQGVSVRWFDAATDADDALRAHVALVAGVDAASVEVDRRDGEPHASHGVHVSLSRSGPYLVTAVSTGGPVGVDVEAVDEVERAWDSFSSYVEAKDVPQGSGRAAVWCRAQAAHARDGRAASSGPSGSPAPDGAPSVGLVDDLVAPSGYCAAVAYL